MSTATTATPNGPPPGPKPLSFDETQTDGERAVTIACCIMVAITLFFRCLGRYAMKLRNDAEYGGYAHFLGLDDVLNFFAVLAFYALAISVLVAVDRGMGTHLTRIIWLKGMDGVNDYNLAIYICALTYNTVLGLVKLSVLALYRRILQGVPSRTLNGLNWAIVALVTTNTTINVLIAAFQCNPIEAAFNSSIEGRCINASAFYIGNAITGIVTDTAVYLLAIPIVRPLQMKKKRKAVILLTLLVGLFAVITSCVRLSFLPSLLVNPDTSWAMAVPMDWSVVEPAVGILVSSMPAIRSVMYLWNPNIGRSQNNSSSFDSQLESSHKHHIKLHDFVPAKVEAATTTVVSRKPAAVLVEDDDDSEKDLIYQEATTRAKHHDIRKTTDFEITRTDVS